MAERITLDRGKRLAEQPEMGHNRWHPDIPPILSIQPGETVVMDTLDARDGRMGPETTLADVETLNSNVPHPLTGPVSVTGAEPGDLLAVHIGQVEPQSYGWTSITPYVFGLEDKSVKGLARWDIADGHATTKDIPGVRIPAASFLGVMGVAPSHALMEEARQREAALHDLGGAARLPTADGAVPATEPIASQGLRTIPPRENGGNVDIKQLTAGTTLYLPVYVPGALFSCGDAHFAQGEGEVCGTAIEMGATSTLRFDLIKGGARGRKDVSYAREDYFTAPGMAVPRRFFATTGICVNRNDGGGAAGTNEPGDLTLAAKNALINMAEHLEREYGYTTAQAYLICSVAVDLRISQVVNHPNFLVSAFLPLDIFTG